MTMVANEVGGSNSSNKLTWPVTFGPSASADRTKLGWAVDDSEIGEVLLEELRHLAVRRPHLQTRRPGEERLDRDLRTPDDLGIEPHSVFLYQPETFVRNARSSLSSSSLERLRWLLSHSYSSWMPFSTAAGASGLTHAESYTMPDGVYPSGMV